MDKKREYEELEHHCRENSKEPIVFGSKNINAKIALVGEAPGAKEIELNKPFVGQAGKNLNEFLEIVNLKREDIYITNVVKIRPYRINPKTQRKSNRPPNKREIEKYSKYLIKELEIIKPILIVTLGNVPLKTLLENKDIKIGDIHGEVQFYNNLRIFPLYHPAAVIYNRQLKEIYLEDLIKLKEYIKKNLII